MGDLRNCTHRLIAEGRQELQGVLDATLRRLEASISAARSQEARVAELLKQVLNLRPHDLREHPAGICADMVVACAHMQRASTCVHVGGGYNAAKGRAATTLERAQGGFSR